ncbi:MAG: glycoside hydrolase family 88 protein [Asticcacaulis sp.]|nr:glycoside hydrolase family 88 protein [Asticcacaulis sp.]
MSKRTLTMVATVAALMMAAAAAAQTPEMPSPHFDANAVPQATDVIAAMKREASAEVARLQAIDAAPDTARERGGGVSPNWVSATFFIGAMRLTHLADAPDVLDYTMKVSQRYNYALRTGGAPVNLLNADDQTLGDVYQDIYLRQGLPGVLMPLQQRLDYTVPYLRKTPEPKRLVWWWCDALFMAPPVLARMSAITGDAKYIDAMDVQWWRAYDRLWDDKEHLFARDERFVTRVDDNGKKIFWSRGEGWVLAGLARLLEVMPADYPSRPRYVKVYQQMAAKIITLQQPDGLWRASLLDTAAFPEAETSGTALDTFALAFGINHGLLDRKVYLPHVTRAWAGLHDYILPNGILGQVQTGGDQPVPTKRETTGLYASGAYLLAGSEVAKLNDAATPLPVALTPPVAMTLVPSDIGPSRPPATPAEEKENRRRELERQAVKALAYDPVTDDPDYTPVYNMGTKVKKQGNAK